ncbi:hypothetical protein LTR47_005434 [Exophiala xenobiotica]|nr:hypothetical protein LTR47_005434 [Exophiala xenobiotica]KAK5246560.1 hypothetical protein LTS06_008136 [Exophiala xenobiotica]KAK5261637.1 hypothetical protein LTR40_001800 [Exophiala xenobiotica]KAK5314783.1 hypothetical protein LTR93_010166 [Exophiala xenobiotica]KAK5345566.1 hypothetical protein LTR61_010689 [Exophiala xenobiotica]
MSRAIIVLYIEPSPEASAPAVEKWRTQILKSIPSANWIRKVVASDKISDSQPYREQFIVDMDNLKDATEEVIQSLRSDACDIVAHSEWHIYREISRKLRQGVQSTDYPPSGTELVQVSMDPTPQAVQDYHDWFDKEHLRMLSDIPGWRSTSRYELAASYGDGKEAAWPFMSANEYEVENGLGGPIWQKSMDTPWTVRVLANLSKPNHRRTWKYAPL